MINRLFSLFVALVAIVGLSACTSDTKTPEVKKDVDIVASADNSASLEIPKGALPEGTDLSSIKIEKMPIEDGILDVEEGETVVYYNMEPDGLEFKEDIIFETELKGVKGKLPFFYHISNGKAEAADVEYHVKGDDVSVKIPVSHFSGMASVQWQYDSVEIDASVSDTYVGNNVVGMAQVVLLEKEAVEGSIKISGHISSSYGPTGPKKVLNRPPKSTFTSSYTVNTTNDFTCKYAGKSQLAFYIDVNWGTKIIEDGREYSWLWPNKAKISIWEDFECKDEKPNFELHMANLPATNFDYEYIDVEGKSEKELKKLGKTLRIHAFNYLRNDRDEYFPFPDAQFDLDERVYADHERGSDGGYCASAHFNKPKALDYSGGWKEEPEDVCGWGAPDFNTGALIVTPKQLSKWLEAYGGAGG